MARGLKFITVDFDPELWVVQQDLAHVRAGFEHKTELMSIIEAEAHKDVERMFETEKDALGKRWRYWKRTPRKPPSASYAHRAEHLPNKGILDRYGREDGLRAQATSWDAFRVVGGQMTYGHGLPDWSWVHLHGGHVIETKDGMYEIPQRSFYPFSKGAAARVGRIFNAWAAKNVAVIERVSPRGLKWVQVQTRTPTGRFGSSPL